MWGSGILPFVIYVIIIFFHSYWCAFSSILLLNWQLNIQIKTKSIKTKNKSMNVRSALGNAKESVLSWCVGEHGTVKLAKSRTRRSFTKLTNRQLKKNSLFIWLSMYLSTYLFDYKLNIYLFLFIHSFMSFCPYLFIKMQLLKASDIN